MDHDLSTKDYIVFDSKDFSDEKVKPQGDPSRSVLGIVRAPDKNHAQDTASTVFPDRLVFVRERDEAEREYVDTAEKMGYLNSSQAHRPLG